MVDIWKSSSVDTSMVSMYVCVAFVAELFVGTASLAYRPLGGWSAFPVLHIADSFSILAIPNRVCGVHPNSFVGSQWH